MEQPLTIGIPGILQLFPSLNKVVFLDDDVVVQADLSPLWDIDLQGKVNGAVETCRGADKFVMSKRLKHYLNFSHPLISKNFQPDECAWAYGMNVFDLEAWRKTNISVTYYHWLQMVRLQVVKASSSCCCELIFCYFLSWTHPLPCFLFLFIPHRTWNQI